MAVATPLANRSLLRKLIYTFCGMLPEMAKNRAISRLLLWLMRVWGCGPPLRFSPVQFKHDVLIASNVQPDVHRSLIQNGCLLLPSTWELKVLCDYITAYNIVCFGPGSYLSPSIRGLVTAVRRYGGTAGGTANPSSPQGGLCNGMYHTNFMVSLLLGCLLRRLNRQCHRIGPASAGQ